MKNLLLLFAFISSLTALSAQCGAPQSSIDLQGNNIRARILGGGDLFTDFSDGQFIVNPDPNGGNKPSTIFAAGLWMGGLDAGQNLKMAAVDYRSASGTDYSAGPLTVAGTTDAFTCANWDRHFRVTGARIAQFLDALPLTQAQAVQQFPEIMGWPAMGNVTFSSIWGFDLPTAFSPLAPYFDANGNGQYNPLSGDYPVVWLAGKEPFVPAEMIWCVFNDQKGGAVHPVTGAQPIQAEVQLTAWAFNCSNEPVLNNTIFTSHKIINRATENIDSFHIGLWVDVDLGCYQDDYVGCDPSRNTMFAYNQDPQDGNPGTSCSGTPTFGTNLPVQTVTFLPVYEFLPPLTLDKFIAFGSGGPATQDPASTDEYAQNLFGQWKDGTPITQGGTGYGGTTPTNLMFPDNPSSPTGWTMCTSGLSASDRRMLGINHFGLMQPGQVTEINAAWTIHENMPSPCSIGNALSNVDIILAHHANAYQDVCSDVSKAPVLPSENLDLFPNPTTGDATLRYGAIHVEEIRVFDGAGRLVQTLNQPKRGEITLHLGQFQTGFYTLCILTDQGFVTKKLAIVR